jgi:hypothetical protein
MQRRTFGMPPGVLAVALALASLDAGSAGAQEPCRHCVDGFRFLPSSIVGDPFANTRFINATGGGMAVDLQVPVRNIAGNVVDSLAGDIGFLLLDFEYQYAVARWLAVRATAVAVGRVGTSTESVVASGISAGFGGSLGATVPVWHNQKFFVSAVGDVRRSTVYEVDPYAFARGIIEDGYDSTTKQLLLRDVPINRWSAGLRGAWGIRPWVGLNADVESGLVDSPENDNESLTEVGVQVGFDFGKLSRYPIGLSLAYRGQSGPGRTGDVSGSYQIYELGLFYTGRSQFMIGGDVFWSRVAVRDEAVADLDAVQFRLVTRIDF